MLSAQRSEEDPSSSFLAARDVLSSAQAAESAPIFGAIDHNELQAFEADCGLVQPSRANGSGKGVNGTKKVTAQHKVSRSLMARPSTQPSTPSFLAREAPVISQADKQEE